jgi:hypothetical protein
MRRLVVALAVLLVVDLMGPVATGRSAGAAGAPLLFGAAQAAHPGVTAQQAVTSLEHSIGRTAGSPSGTLAAIRIYDSWDSVFPDPYIDWLKGTGHTVFLSVKPRHANGSPLSWAGIANAQPGSAVYAGLQRWAANLKAFGKHMYFAFNHEPDIHSSAVFGSPAEFVAAWRKVRSVLLASGVTNVEYVWTVAESNFFVAATDSRYAPKFYPGDAYVDDIAVDAYNMYCLRNDGRYQKPWMSLQQVLAPLMTFAQAHAGPGLMMAEFGTPEDPKVAGRKAQWFTDARALLKQPGYQRFKAVLYWNQTSDIFANCNFRVNTSASSLQAYAAMANDPYYSARAP